MSAAKLGMELKFIGVGLNEYAIVVSVTGDKAPKVRVGQVIVKVDPHYFRPTEVDTLLGDASKAREKLGWQPEISFDQLIDEMVACDLDIARQHDLLHSHGYKI